MKENEELRREKIKLDQMSKLHLHKLTECFHFKMELAKFLLNASLEALPVGIISKNPK